jgi:hypothetical protein
MENEKLFSTTCVHSFHSHNGRYQSPKGVKDHVAQTVKDHLALFTKAGAYESSPEHFQSLNLFP